jgi:HD-like signal output (HDOD) protein/CheY-like chemotaxis protein
MKHILFVDDEPNILEGLQRMLFPFQREWHMAFASGGQGALDVLQKEHFDVVVSDMRMPGMDGAELLERIKEEYPDTVRFVLTGQSDSETVYRSVGDAHQFLTKPCKPQLLKDSVDRAFAIRDLLENDRLKAVISRIGSLPPMPQTYAQLCKELQSSEASAAKIGQIIESDLAMTAKILQLVNSAFFGVRQHVSSASQAAALLGFETVKALVLMTGIFSHAEKVKLPSGFSFEALWRHSAQVGAFAQAICRSENACKGSANDAYTAGLLHDAGELILAAACQEDYTHAYDYAMVNEVRLQEAERELLGCTHAEIGAYLLGIWGLPHPIVEAVAYHHRPSEAVGTEFSPLAAVHVADALAWSHGSQESQYPLPEVDQEFLGHIGLADRLGNWETVCTALDTKERD